MRDATQSLPVLFLSVLVYTNCVTQITPDPFSACIVA